MAVPVYPDFAPLGLDMRQDLYPTLNMNADGISEFTFSNLYLFRGTYDYRMSRVPGMTFILSGVRDGKRFVSFPCDFPPREVFEELMRTHDYAKNLSERLTNLHRIEIEGWGYEVHEDRNNFDYLYLRKDLAELSGRHYHKKRNLVNAFINSYHFEERELDEARVPECVGILEKWCEEKGIKGDYVAAREGLERFRELGMRGCVYYVDDKPAGYALGEPLAKGRMFAIHFEKGSDAYKGIYQFINQAFAQTLPRYFTHINREQDLGDEGLKQAKMTYRPSGFVKKYRVVKKG